MKKIFIMILMISLMSGFAPGFEVSTVAADEQFEWVVPCEWAYISEFSEGLAIIRGYNAYGGEGFCGFIDRFGKIQIPLAWDEAKLFSEGLAPVKRGDKWGYINQNGEVVIEPQFDGVGMFFEDRAWVRTNGDNGWSYGFINKSGELVTDLIYSNVRQFQEGLSAVCKDNQWGYINPNGQVVIDFNYGVANSFNDGYAIVEFRGGEHFDNNRRIIIDRTGNVILDGVNQPLMYDEKSQAMWIFYRGRIDKSEYGHVGYSYTDDLLTRAFKNPENIPQVEEASYPQAVYSEKYGMFVTFDSGTQKMQFFDHNFNLVNVADDVIWVGFDADISDSGTFAVSKNGDKGQDDNQGYIDIRGYMVIAPSFWQAQTFSEGRGVVYDANRRYGIIRLANDGDLYSPNTEQVATAYPTVVKINGIEQNAYTINDRAYIDANILPKYGLNVIENEHNNIFITRNFVRSKPDVPDALKRTDSYEVYNTDKTVCVGNNVANAYQVDGNVVVQADELSIYGTVNWNDRTKELSVFIDAPYLRNEGILWESVTDPNGISWAIFQDGYYILKTPQGKVSVYNSDLEFLFEEHTAWWGPDVYKGIFRFQREPNEYFYTNELGEAVPEPEEFLPYSRPRPYEITPDPYPLLKIEGRIHAGSGRYSSWGTVKYYDENDTVILDDDWDDAGPFINGTALVYKGGSLTYGGMSGGLWGLIDTNGNYIAEAKWENASRYADGKIRLYEYRGVNGADSVTGLLDERGNELLPMEYGDIDYTAGSDYVVVSSKHSIYDGGAHLVDLNNNSIIPPYFSRIEEQQNGVYAATSWNGVNIIRMIDMPLLNGSVFVNNEKVEFDTLPLLINSRAMVPIRAVFEKMDCLVQWLEDNNTAVITRGDMRVEIKQDTNFITINGEYIYSDTAAINYNNRIYVPLRVISETLGCDVSYDDATENVMITY